MIDWVPTFIVFFAVIDPIGTVPVFLAVTRGHDQPTKRRIAFAASVAAALILMFFLIAGEIILDAMGVPMAAFQIAGGIVLFLFALSMIFGESKPEEEVKLARNASDLAIFPLAVPSIAGPGAMLAAVLLTKNASNSIWQQAQTAITMLLVLVVAWVLMLGATRIDRLIGAAGASIISRVMGLILASVATTNTLAGFEEYFGL